ncbi:hypothetical protein ACFVU2_01135 [Leifsonia sp. NPDC058194]|uniref:hypothetical protein n=1 Tax=Leifsonia sp. NPDC058194 TaxID=3346374 RepID=UPI0036DD6CCF
MSTILQSKTPSASRAASGAARTRSTASRWITGSALVVAGVLAVLFEQAIRVVETQAATSLVGSLFASGTMFASNAGDPVIGFTMGHGWFAAQATVVSGSAFFVGAVAIVGGLLALTGRIPAPRVLTISVLGVVALLILNQARLVLTALYMGSTAQQGAHPLDHPLGSAAMIVAVAGVLTFFFFAVRSARRAHTA